MFPNDAQGLGHFLKSLSTHGRKLEILPSLANERSVTRSHLILCQLHLDVDGPNFSLANSLLTNSNRGRDTLR